MSFDLWALLVALGGGIGAMLLAWAKGRAAGRDAVIVEQAKNDDRTRKEFERIDAQSPDVNSSIERLRQRAAKPRDAGSK